MQKQKVCHYVFHNTNTKEEMEDFLIKWLTGLNQRKVEKLLEQQIQSREKKAVKSQKGGKAG